MPWVISADTLRPLLTLNHLSDLTLHYFDSSDAFEVIRQLPHIRRLRLNACQTDGLAKFIGDGTLQPISRTLETIDKLCIRDDDYNDFCSGPILHSSLLSAFARFTPNISSALEITWQSVADPWLLLGGWSINLTSLDLVLDAVKSQAPDVVASALSRCTNLTKLHIQCAKMTHDHLPKILSSLHHLSELCLSGTTGLTSLKAFTSANTRHLRTTLKGLAIDHAQVPPKDVSCLYVLRGLRSLSLTYAFSSILNSSTRKALGRTSSFRAKHFPSLTNFYLATGEFD